MMSDTIYALATIAGRAGVAVIRVTGNHSRRVLQDFSITTEVFPRKANFAIIRCPITKEILDEIIYLYFVAPKSFTGEDIVELHLHGSVAVIDDVLGALSRLSYLRLAEPGEFSRRAFFNGKMDLTKAEGLADLIDAETSIQRKVALRQLSGELESLYDLWRTQLITILAKLEVLIDFPDDDLPQEVIEEIAKEIDLLRRGMRHHLSQNNAGEVIRRGVNIAIIGRPNAGKSSFLNLLAQRDVAIVSDIAGTTRDVLQVKIDIAGFPVIFYDTAGICSSTNSIENEGIKRAKKTAADADIQLIMLDATQEYPEELFALSELADNKHITIINKIDIASDRQLEQLSKQCKDRKIKISATKDLGVAEFLAIIKEKIIISYSPSSDPLLTRIRYRKALEQCLINLNDFDIEKPLDLASEDVRIAANNLGSILGKIDIEEILDIVFGAFCIGK